MIWFCWSSCLCTKYVCPLLATPSFMCIPYLLWYKIYKVNIFLLYFHLYTFLLQIILDRHVWFIFIVGILYHTHLNIIYCIVIKLSADLCQEVYWLSPTIVGLRAKPSCLDRRFPKYSKLRSSALQFIRGCQIRPN